MFLLHVAGTYTRKAWGEFLISHGYSRKVCTEWVLFSMPSLLPIKREMDENNYWE